MAQPRIDQLAALVESSEREGEGGSDHDGDSGGRGPFRVALVGDSTMMQQHGVLCAFLGERPGRRFDPSVRVRAVLRDHNKIKSQQNCTQGIVNSPLKSPASFLSFVGRQVPYLIVFFSFSRVFTQESADFFIVPGGVLVPG